MLPVVVRLEEGEAEVELEHDATHAPYITGLGPAVLCNVEYTNAMISMQIQQPLKTNKANKQMGLII